MGLTILIIGFLLSSSVAAQTNNTILMNDIVVANSTAAQTFNWSFPYVKFDYDQFRQKFQLVLYARESFDNYLVAFRDLDRLAFASDPVITHELPRIQFKPRPLQNLEFTETVTLIIFFIIIIPLAIGIVEIDEDDDE
ncbi:uncharacterized protein [Diabrotica undecimpunctata]|uniref:uncharacterized protein isoform X1 n=1 Tax=Diabrotica undecimpunctata TaxID=50387 RepID=UPI003B63F505